MFAWQLGAGLSFTEMYERMALDVVHAEERAEAERNY